MRRSLGFAAAVLSMASLSASANLVIGNFEGGVAEPGWGEWGSGVQPFSSIITISNEAATLGAGSAKITQAGYDQNLAFGADFATRQAFLAHDKLLFDVIYPATTTGGFAQIFEVAVNSQYGGFVGLNLSGQGVGWGPDGGAAITRTYEYDYSSGSTNHKATWLANGLPGWVEIIFATNSDSTHGVFYIDNVRLVAIPEPTSLAGIGVASMLMLRRRK